MTATIQVNGRTYQSRNKPVVGVCLDGADPAYLDAAASVMPNLRRMATNGTEGQAQSVIPSFTNPNNLALVTGVPPEVNGICGNYYYDQASREEVMMTDPDHLWCPTILAAFAKAGKSVGVITTKEKLRRLLGKDLTGICFSVECARSASKAENGIDSIESVIGRKAPSIYDPEISVFCIEAGAKLLRDQNIDVLYLSTTDYVQHKYGPESPEAQHFFARIDQYLGELDRLGAIVGITADHGMNRKTHPDGSPKVQFLETILSENGLGSRVILPITDPYVVHHGALGSYATVYLDNGGLGKARRILEQIPGIELVLDREEAQKRFSLPPSRIGDLVVLSNKDTTLGRTPGWHDLAAVSTGLRSHGGLHERTVPFIVNRRLLPEYAAALKSGYVNNYDLFDFLCNGTEAD
jgi:phosphonoacetate hydrolase